MRQIYAHSGIIMHIQELFRHIQVCPKPCVTLTYLESWYIQNTDKFRTTSIFRTLAYSEPWYIQNPRIFRTLAYSKSEAYSEPCQTSMIKRFSKIVNGYNYFRKLKLFWQYKLVAFSTSWNKYHEVVTPKVVILCKKLSWTRGSGTVNFWYTHWHIQMN